ncbi:16S rRNA (cytosine(967)-C(5))-methyltransferase RsmB [uncultured Oscillibacter sp.]|uniref:16S rRNA (cytosine(967)-C(5))-methyltransferase RsmB n=1 Tax=uncultured Oscillibacter sp. TaxID=876091 RepID=UPI0025D5F262|nr:16S rRNA (cytosine(967)-C(5))-methyltransferase RsmB [uncultured Oscillibacter sp.]
MSARREALSVLTACRVRGAWADAALGPRLAGLSPADAGLCSRIVYGVIQNEALLDFYLSRYCTQKLERLQPPLADILRIGAYQILFLDRVPDSAAVHTSVELAKDAGRGPAAGLVNAVLRRLSREKGALPAIPDRDEAGYLSIRYSHPKWLVKRLLALLGREEAEAFLAAGNSQPPMAAQVNTCRSSAGAARRALEDEGVRVEEHPWLPDCLLLSGTGDLERLAAFRDGAVYIQDPAARLAVLAADLRPESRVLDVCAAPGGKSFAAAIAMGGQGEILACDLHENKLRRIQEGAARLGLGCIRTAAADGRAFREEWRDAFDLVLVDAPCSGLGILRKKPDIRRKGADSLFALPVIQSAILENAARYVRPGGTLVYATCTILPEEDEEVTDAFLGLHPGFSRESFALPGPIGGTEGQVTLWPHLHGTDGFYICRMTRRG